jgi:hypothetical protein
MYLRKIFIVTFFVLLLSSMVLALKVDHHEADHMKRAHN